MTEHIFPSEEMARDATKVWSLAKALKIAMVSVMPEWVSKAARPNSVTEPVGGACPMRARFQEGSNIIWFIMSRDAVMAELNDATPIMLTFSNGGEGDHIVFQGYASISDDRDMLKALWDAHASVHFPQGPEDAQALLMRFEPQQAQFWTDGQDVISFVVHYVNAILTGQPQTVGRHGFVPIQPAE
jgi:general stress protein 26